MSKNSVMWDKAADFLEANGFTKGAYCRLQSRSIEDPDGPLKDCFCSLGAFIVGNGLCTKEVAAAPIAPADAAAGAAEAEAEAEAANHPYWIGVVSFNDSDTTTKETAISAMRSMADIFRQKGD